MSREAFEAWVMQKRGITRDVTIDGGMYWVGEVEIAWQGWQAARAAALDEAARKVENYCGAWDDEGYALAMEIRALKEQG